MRLTPAKLTFAMILVVSGLLGAYVAKKVYATEAVHFARLASGEREYVQVPVTISDLPAGTRIAAEHLRLVRLPASAVGHGVAVHAPQLVGRTVNQEISQANPIQMSQLLPAGNGEQGPAMVQAPMTRVAASPIQQPQQPTVDDANRHPETHAESGGTDRTPSREVAEIQPDADRFVAEIFSGTSRTLVEFRDGRRID